MDEILHHLRKPAMNDPPANTNQQCLPMVSKWCEMEFATIHGMTTADAASGHGRGSSPQVARLDTVALDSYSVLASLENI